jgi:hypothetical protein
VGAARGGRLAAWRQLVNSVFQSTTSKSTLTPDALEVLLEELVHRQGLHLPEPLALICTLRLSGRCGP